MFYPAKIVSERLSLFQRGAHAQRYPLPCWQGRLGTNYFSSSVMAGAVALSRGIRYVRSVGGRDGACTRHCLPGFAMGRSPVLARVSPLRQRKQACAIRMANHRGAWGIFSSGLVVALYRDALDAHIPRPYAVRTAAKLYLLVLVAEGFGRTLRDHILGPLLQQGSAQVSLVARNLVVLVLISITVLQGQVHLNDVILIELVASTLATVIALRALAQYLKAHRHLAGQDDWQPQNWREKWHVARHMYFNHLITLTYSPQAFVS